MPNWCDNYIEVRGDIDTIKSLWQNAKQDGLLQTLNPMPPDLEGTTAPFDTPNWYVWCVNNWGTKWEVDLEDLRYEESEGTAQIIGSFQSPWAPPTNAFAAYLDRVGDGVDIRLYYEEGGTAFIGRWDNGQEAFYLDYANLSADEVEAALADEPYLEELFNLVERLHEYEREEVA